MGVLYNTGICSRNTLVITIHQSEAEVASVGNLQAAKPRGKYPLLAIDTEVDSCFIIN